MKTKLSFYKGKQRALFFFFSAIFFFSYSIKAQSTISCTGKWGPPILNQTFGQGNASSNWYGPLSAYAPGASTSTIFVGAAGPVGGQLSDGYSGLVKSPITGGNGFLNLPDHTGNQNGLMMLVNAPSTAATVFFEYVMNNLCSNTTLRLSLWILNVNTPGTCGAGYQFPNVTLRAVDNNTGNVLGTSTTGNIPINSVWTEYSVVFNNASSSSVKLQIVNNSVGNGCGNDLAIDDIMISPCIPETIKAIPNSATTICAGQNTPINFTASLTGSSYNPAEYQWQESIDSGITWLDQGGPTTNPNYTFNPAGKSPGSYWIRFKVGPQGSALNALCNAVSETAIVKIVPLPVVNDAVMESCFIESNPVSAVFDLTSANVTSETIGITKKFYQTLANAVAGTNEILPAGTFISTNTDVYVRVINSSGCYSISKITLKVIPSVKSAVLKDKTICIEDRTTLDAGPGFDGYEWSTGAVTQTIQDIGVGAYWVKLKTSKCFTLQKVNVYASKQPVIASLDIKNNTITVNASGGTAPYQYSSDGINWQNSNVFTNLPRGENKIFLRDSFDCTPITVQVTVPNLLNAITPNDDNLNDEIDYSALAYKKNLVFTVYNRYGNKIYEADKVRNYKWNGTSGGKKIVTGTYWYTIIWNENDKNSTQTTYNGWVLVKNRE
nr:gliding motility-associated C-terminal domain-containing protein [uncultured Chryseobacterium sp.]